MDDAAGREQLHEVHRVLREHSADQGRGRPTDDAGEQVHLGERGIEVDEPLHVFRAAHREAGADRAAPVVHHERKRADPQFVEQRLQVVDAVGRAEEDVGGPIGKPAANMVGHDHAVAVPQARDQVAEQEAPGGIAVQADDDGPLPLVDEVHPVARPARAVAAVPLADRGESGSKRIRGPVGERRRIVIGPVGCAVGGRESAHGDYHSNPRKRVLSPLPNAVSSTFSRGWMSFSSTPIASAAGRATETMLP